MRVLIVGGVAGGASAAARLRRIDEKAEIIVFEKGPHISFANCGLPYYIGDIISEKEKLLVQTPQSMKDRFNIDVRVDSEVISINPDKKEIEVLDIKNNKKYKEVYDKLILSPGAEPIRPKLPGIELNNIFTLRNMPDTYAIRNFVDEKKPQSAAVIGGGFIGIEMAENLASRGIKVTLIELSSQVMAPLDIEMAAMVHQKLVRENIKLILNDGVKAFSESGNGIQLELNSGNKLLADMVILSIGVKPETHLAKQAGLKLGPLGGIAVDGRMQTSDPDIYAVGDAIEVTDLINGNSALIPLAGPANKQGRIAANAIAGKNDNYKGTLGAAIVKVFDMTVASVGNNEKTLKKYNIRYEKIYTHTYSHAGYYPKAMPLSIKLLFNPDNGKIFGAQIIGYEGVDKRIDVIATALRAGMTVFDLEELELAYAPPYSSAKDPVNMASFVAANIINGDSEIIHWDQIDSLNKEKTLLIDVRTKVEHEAGAIKGSINIPLDEIRGRFDEIPKDKEIVLYCQVGLRGYIAYRILRQSGYSNVKNLSGGYKTYQTAFKKLM